MRWLGLLTSALLVGSAWAQEFDVLIRGGRVLDGTGNPWFYADIGIRGDRIAAIGNLQHATARRVINATGLYVCPGFIDLHSHADDSSPAYRGLRHEDARRRSGPNLISQGITTVVVNQDGRSPWPIQEQRAQMERLGIGPNAILLVGHGTVRAQVMGQDFRRPATPEEIERMRALVRQGMQEGAWGLSAGLEYVPGRWSTTDELIALVREIVPYGGVYIAHERSEGRTPMWYWPSQDPPGPPTLLDAVQETIEIGRQTGAVVVASHIKAKNYGYWGSSQAAIYLIDEARKQGVQIYADQYTYTTSGSDGNTVLIPDWVFAGIARGTDGQRPDYKAHFERALAERGQALRADIQHEIERRGGPDRIVLFEYPDSSLIGKSLAEVARAWGLSPVEAAIRIQREGFNRPGGARMRGFSMDELDVRLYMQQPWTATATDGGIALPEDGPAVHPRFYGTYPRKIARYARDWGVISLEQAIRSSSGLPAQILGLKDRGYIREGYYADLVIFDLDRIEDKATFFDPHQHAEGIRYVFVNGVPVLDEGRLTGALPGRVLTPRPLGPPTAAPRRGR
ncbi:MAG: D-aminoacylase [Bacteroidota bacterium]|nr:D-aminoacylase [Rhodothermia bacterium]MCS7154627.1 D-aminoacylase [Bacteroidota bacterium]MDW8137420.1 D-aminoacylase [Bacteroidota bacterium]MDW8285626.1 D-aminoacylase [Bacteroidota bacterium]